MNNSAYFVINSVFVAYMLAIMYASVLKYLHVKFAILCNSQCSRSVHYARDVLVNINKTAGSKMIYLLVQPLLVEYFLTPGVSTNGIYILLDVLVYSIALYFYELCRILKSP